MARTSRLNKLTVPTRDNVQWEKNYEKVDEKKGGQCNKRKKENYEGEMESKGTVSLDNKCLEVISIENPLLGHVTPDILNIWLTPFNV